MSRWERRPLADTSLDENPQPNDIMLSGKHAGRQYQDIFENERHYCQWVLSTMEHEKNPAPEIKRLAIFIVKQESQAASSVPTMKRTVWHSLEQDDAMSTHSSIDLVQ